MFRCLDSTLTIITYLSSNVNIFRETTPAESRMIKKNYSSCSDHLAVAKIFSEWNTTRDRYSNDSNYYSNNLSLSNNSLILMYSKYYTHFFDIIIFNDYV
jgi:hypothetical protein